MVQPLEREDPKNIDLLRLLYTSTWRMADTKAPSVDSKNQEEALALYLQALEARAQMGGASAQRC
jgi:hypothetical protein